MVENLMDIDPVKDWVFIEIIDRGERQSAGGLIIPDDDFKAHGVRPRLCKILAINSKSAEHGISPGDFVIIGHGEWTRKLGTTIIDGEEVPYWGVPYQKVKMIIEEPDGTIVG